jgi:hypothetical protein
VRMLTRRVFSYGFLAAPAIVQTGLLMPVKPRLFTYDEALAWIKDDLAKSITYDLTQKPMYGPHSYDPVLRTISFCVTL